MSNAYQVAMTLRAMHHKDRQWLISQLSSDEKLAIRELIAGDQTNPATQGSNFELAVAREELNQLPVPEAVSNLLSLDASQIASVLEHEPDWCVALILDAYRWPWHSSLLELLGPDRKARIARLTFGTPRPNVVESMLKGLYERARLIRPHPTKHAVIPPQENAAPTPHRHHHWLRGIAKWLP